MVKRRYLQTMLRSRWQRPPVVSGCNLPGRRKFKKRTPFVLHCLCEPCSQFAALQIHTLPETFHLIADSYFFFSKQSLELFAYHYHSIRLRLRCCNLISSCNERAYACTFLFEGLRLFVASIKNSRDAEDSARVHFVWGSFHVDKPDGDRKPDELLRPTESPISCNCLSRRKRHSVPANSLAINGENAA